MTRPMFKMKKILMSRIPTKSLRTKEFMPEASSNLINWKDLIKLMIIQTILLIKISAERVLIEDLLLEIQLEEDNQMTKKEMLEIQKTVAAIDQTF